jgi:uncharacterized protein
MHYDNSHFNEEHLREIRPGVELFNDKMYWECHEVLEDPWMEHRGEPVQMVFWAVIQVAISLVHVRNENLAGSKGMLDKAKNKFAQCEKNGCESPLLDKFLGWSRFKKLVFSIGENPGLEDFEKLYAFKFSNPIKWDEHLNKDK